MAEESEKKRRAMVADRLKAMFKAGAQLPIPDQMRAAGERSEADGSETPAPKKTRRRGP